MATTIFSILFLPDVPRHSQRQPFTDVLRGRVAQALRGFADFGQAMAHIASAEVAVHGLGALQVRVAGKQVAVQLGIQLIERGPVAHGHVVNLVHGFGVLRGSGQQVGLHHVGNKAEVAAGFAVAIDVDRLALDHAGNPLGDDGCVGAIWVLARAEDVEVAQADALHAVGFAEHVGVQLVHVLGDGVG